MKCEIMSASIYREAAFNENAWRRCISAAAVNRGECDARAAADERDEVDNIISRRVRETSSAREAIWPCRRRVRFIRARREAPLI